MEMWTYAVLLMNKTTYEKYVEKLKMTDNA
jgi:hypothetical protein